MVIVALALSGCLSSTSHDLSPALASRKTEPSGIVVGSIGTPQRDNVYGRLILKMREISQDERVWAFLDRTTLQKTPLDFVEQGVEGAVFAMKLPAGQYEMRNFEFFWNAGFFQKSFEAKQDFSIRFDVRPNEVTYLGEFIGVPLSGKNVFGSPVPAGGFWIVTDRHTRDIEVARGRNPTDSFENVRMAIPDVKALKLPFFVTRKDEAPPPQIDSRATTTQDQTAER